MNARSPASLTSTLRDVSRSFYLTLRVLPPPIRRQIGLAYLLARATDTIADTGLLPLERRLSALERLRGRIEGSSTEPLNFADLADQQGSPAERLLLETIEKPLRELEGFATSDRDLVRAVLRTITGGQELDLRRFAEASISRVIALETDQQLDDYTHRVAGCVGEFWTKICRNHLFPGAPLDEQAMLSRGIKFGKGLQLVNILRDLPKDLRQGRCYLPLVRLRELRLDPQDLLKPENDATLRPLYDDYLCRAERFLSEGWVYANTVPRKCFRVRLACAWPVLIGLDTIALLRKTAVLGTGSPVKISRSRVRTLMLKTVLLYPWPAAWSGLVVSPQ